MDKLAYLIVAVNIFCVYSDVQITEIRGPDSIKYGTAEEIILDCVYQADSDSRKNLEVKWYYNDDSNMIYQWIPESNKAGYSKGAFRDHVDVTYIATNDSNTKHRALRIYNITTDLTGNYTCKVSSFQGEDTETKQLIIYDVPESSLDVALMEEQQTVVCTAHGIYPQPEVNLYFSKKNSSKIDVEDITVNNTVDYEIDDNGFYNITKVYIFPNMTDFERNAKFVCELTIPGTNCLQSLTVIYQAEKSGVMQASAVSLSVIMAMVFLIICK